MLDIFKNDQPLFFEEITNSINNNKISHAFLIESNGYLKKDELLIEFVKTLFKKYIPDEEEFLNVSTLIDNNTFSDFMIIEPDGAFIKKEQILEIKENFKTTSLDDRPRVYLIKNADKFNKYAANSLLKFLEEPEGNIIAILEANNRYRVMETIRSRCQIYSLINKDKSIEIENIDLIYKIVECLERNGKKSIAFLSSELDNDLRNKEFWIDTFNIMIDIYENAIRKQENISYKEYGNIIDYVAKQNTLQQLINKIDVLFTTLTSLDYNLNISMMLDKFIIDFTGGE